MFVKILIGLVVLVAVFVVVVLSQPSEFRVERSVSISASADRIFAYLNDAHKMNEWSPWVKLDPEMKQTYEGPKSGVGASASWVGNSKVGEGKQTIVESRPNELVRTKLEFLKPFKATSMADFMLVPQGNQTQLTWSMDGQNNFLGKAMSLVMNCDKMVGSQFEQGLSNLKAIVESK